MNLKNNNYKTDKKELCPITGLNCWTTGHKTTKATCGETQKVISI